MSRLRQLREAAKVELPNAGESYESEDGIVSTVLDDGHDPNYEPSDQEVLEYAQWLGMDLPADEPLLWIAREGLAAPLPKEWKACRTDDAEASIYYFNFKTGQSEWQHPMDAYFKEKFEREKKRLQEEQAGKAERLDEKLSKATGDSADERMVFDGNKLVKRTGSSANLKNMARDSADSSDRDADSGLTTPTAASTATGGKASQFVSAAAAGNSNKAAPLNVEDLASTARSNKSNTSTPATTTAASGSGNNNKQAAASSSTTPTSTAAGASSSTPVGAAAKNNAGHSGGGGASSSSAQKNNSANRSRSPVVENTSAATPAAASSSSTKKSAAEKKREHQQQIEAARKQQEQQEKQKQQQQQQQQQPVSSGITFFSASGGNAAAAASSPLVSASTSEPPKRMISEAEKLRNDQIRKEATADHKKRIESAEEQCSSKIASLQKQHDDWAKQQRHDTEDKSQQQIETLQRNIRQKLQQDKDAADGRYRTRISRLERDVTDLKKKLREAEQSNTNSGGSSSADDAAFIAKLRLELDADTEEKVKATRDEINSRRARHATAQKEQIELEKRASEQKISAARKDAEDAAARMEQTETARKKQMHAHAVADLESQADKEIKEEQERAARAKASEGETLVAEVQAKCDKEVRDLERRSRDEVTQIEDEAAAKVRSINAASLAAGGGADDGDSATATEAQRILDGARRDVAEIEKQCDEQIAELRRKSQAEVGQRLRSIREAFESSPLTSTASMVFFNREAVDDLRAHLERERANEDARLKQEMEEMRAELLRLESLLSAHRRNDDFAQQQERALESQFAADMSKFEAEKRRQYSALVAEAEASNRALAAAAREQQRASDAGTAAAQQQALEQHRARAVESVKTRMALDREAKEQDLRRSVNEARSRQEAAVESRVELEIANLRREVEMLQLPYFEIPVVMAPVAAPSASSSSSSGKTLAQRQQEENELLTSILTNLQQQFKQAEEQMVVSAAAAVPPALPIAPAPQQPQQPSQNHYVPQQPQQQQMQQQQHYCQPQQQQHQQQQMMPMPMQQTASVPSSAQNTPVHPSQQQQQQHQQQQSTPRTFSAPIADAVNVIQSQHARSAALESARAQYIASQQQQQHSGRRGGVGQTTPLGGRREPQYADPNTVTGALAALDGRLSMLCSTVQTMMGGEAENHHHHQQQQQQRAKTPNMQQRYSTPNNKGGGTGRKKSGGGGTSGLRGSALRGLDAQNQQMLHKWAVMMGGPPQQ